MKAKITPETARISNAPEQQAPQEQKNVTNGHNVTFKVTYVAKTLEEFESLMAKYPSLRQSSGVAVSKSSAPANGTKGNAEKELAEYLGKAHVRISGAMQQTFELTGDREAQCARFLTLLQSGKVIMTVTGYKWASENESVPMPETMPEDQGGDVL